MATRFRPARLPDDEALLIDLNAEYLEFVFGGVAARFPVTPADIFRGGDIRAYLAGTIGKIVGAGPPESVFHILEQDGQTIGMGGVRRVRDGVAEMKRVYVRDAAKGAGAGPPAGRAADRRWPRAWLSHHVPRYRAHAGNGDWPL